MQKRLDAVESDDACMAELEGRVDFAEWMLAQQRETPWLQGGG